MYVTIHNQKQRIDTMKKITGYKSKIRAIEGKRISNSEKVMMKRHIIIMGLKTLIYHENMRILREDATALYNFIYSSRPPSDGLKISFNDKKNIDFFIDKTVDWNYYSRAYKFPKIWNKLKINLDLSSVLKLKEKGHLEIGGIINKSMKFVKKVSKNGNLYSAVWFKKTRAGIVEVEGHILLAKNRNYHIIDSDANSAYQTFLALEKERVEKNKHLKELRKLKKLKIERFELFEITKEMAMESGNCEVGIDKFMTDIGLTAITYAALLKLSKLDRFKSVKVEIDLVLKHVLNSY